MTTGHAGHLPPATRRLSGGGWPDAHDGLEAAAALVPISDTGRLRKVPEVARVPGSAEGSTPPQGTLARPSGAPGAGCSQVLGHSRLRGPQVSPGSTPGFAGGCTSEYSGP